MINSEKSFNVHDYVEIFLRRLWYVIIPFAVVFAGAVIYAVVSPKEYRASTLILVTPQKVPEAFIRPTVTSKIEDRLSSISQEIMSRTRLEQVISELKLYPELASKSKEEIVELMRSNVKVEFKDKKEGYLGYFTISYIGKDPRMITNVTNKLASLFIEENLKVREQQAQGTSEFLSVELKSTKAKLDEQEKAITDFRRQHFGELPEQRDANLKVLEQLQLLYQRIGENMRSAKDRRLVIQKQMTDTELLLASAPSTKEGSGRPFIPGKDPQEMELEQMKSQLADLQTKYTDKHPDILIAKRRISELEEKIENEKSEKAEGKVVATELPEPKEGVRKEKKVGKSELRLNPRYKEMEGQLIATELEIERLKEEEHKVQSQINIYRGRIENTPLREHEMTSIARDYQHTKESYETLLRKSNEAQQAENLERRQKGEQFKVIDPARVPQKPIKPDVAKILLFGLLLGLGSGLGMAFFREQMDRSFRDPDDVEAALGFKVLANIPKIETQKIEKKAA